MRLGTSCWPFVAVYARWCLQQIHFVVASATWMQQFKVLCCVKTFNKIFFFYCQQHQTCAYPVMWGVSQICAISFLFHCDLVKYLFSGGVNAVKQVVYQSCVVFKSLEECFKVVLKQTLFNLLMHHSLHFIVIFTTTFS